MRKPVIAVTMGDPAGIGPEIVLKAIAKKGIRQSAQFLLIGDSSVLTRAARILKCKNYSAKDIYLVDLADAGSRKFSFGKTDKVCARAALRYVKLAIEFAKAGLVDAIVTAPVSKESIRSVDKAFVGHTELLAREFGVDKFVMMMAAGNLRVSLVTRHMSLSRAVKSLNQKDIYETIVLTGRSLKRHFGIKEPRLAVCGLNPHCGEGGEIGIEEKRIIRPAVMRAKRSLKRLVGPLSAEAVFYDGYRGRYDALICMYHDQALIPFKMVARDRGVNITLGLPITRTSPDHGTAFDIAGKGVADSGSMEEAIFLAAQLSR
ncbi:MAG: 4-hydroxythreonine-4-phosphate dehydrogenase PdxA [Candidatus Omnitrophica bacterium]|nr:4-hydroxythreonine-4-phosphate dehydrogenase PdxA [Candidatus Omnitrophota bacterium]